VIFFRLRDQSIDTKITWLQRILSECADQLDQFIVITDPVRV
jgi:hypothetical protein